MSSSLARVIFEPKPPGKNGMVLSPTCGPFAMARLSVGKVSLMRGALRKCSTSSTFRSHWPSQPRTSLGTAARVSEAKTLDAIGRYSSAPVGTGDTHMLDAAFRTSDRCARLSRVGPSPALVAGVRGRRVVRRSTVGRRCPCAGRRRCHASWWPGHGPRAPTPGYHTERGPGEAVREAAGGAGTPRPSSLHPLP